MLGKSAQVLSLFFLSLTTASYCTELQLETIVTQMIVKENSPLCLNFEYYELDQLFIIQQHVDTVSVEFYEVYVRFTVVATCKSNGPSSCEDQMRLCNAQFNVNGSEVNNDVCNCEAFPDLTFDLEPIDENDNNHANKETAKPVAQRKDQALKSPNVESGENNIRDDDGNENSKKEIKTFTVEKQRESSDKIDQEQFEGIKDHPRTIRNKNANPDQRKEIGSLPKGSLSEIESSENTEKDIKSDDFDLIKQNNSPNVINEVNWSKEKKYLDDDENPDFDVKDLLVSLYKKEEEEKNTQRPVKESGNGSFNSIDLLIFIQSAVEAVNDASHGNLSLTLSKILNISRPVKSKEIYFLQVECNQLKASPQICNISCESQSDKAVRLFNYNCSPLFSQVVPKENRVLHPRKPSFQIQLIAQYAMIQMDEIDADDYRRVVLQVASVTEQITVDGSGVLYSLSVLMVSTACTETTRLNDKESQGCLGQVVSPEQLCNVDCVRSCTSNQPPQLVSSQCGPAPESNGKFLNKRAFFG